MIKMPGNALLPGIFLYQSLHYRLCLDSAFDFHQLVCHLRLLFSEMEPATPALNRI